MMFCVARVRRAGFTLIEIMITVAIIAVLALVAIPNYTRIRAQSNLQVCLKNCQTIGIALESCLIRHSDMEMVWIGSGNGHSGGDESAKWSLFAHMTSGMNGLSDTEGIILSYMVENGYLGEIPTCPVKEPETDVSYMISYNYYHAYYDYEWGRKRWGVQCFGTTHKGFNGGSAPRSLRNSVVNKMKTTRRPIYLLGLGLYENF